MLKFFSRDARMKPINKPLPEQTHTMLTQINIRNFAIAKQLELELKPGMTVITGATGAGKSITLDALNLVLGDRADSNLVRHQAERADISASFDIRKLPKVGQWLKERDLQPGEEGECILRRVISQQGRSRAYINGHNVTLQELKQLGEQLLDIHGQHAHQSLLKKDQHRLLLDSYAGLNELTQKTARHFKTWQQQTQKLEQLQQSNSANYAQVQLLTYQLEELNELDLNLDELNTLEAQQTQLANAEANLQHSHQALNLCDDEQDNGIKSQLQQIQQQLQNIKAASPFLDEATELFSSAYIQVDEAQSSLQSFIDSFEADPGKLQEIETRLDHIYTIARKHKVEARQLPELQQQLNEELASLHISDEDLAELEQAARKSQHHYEEHAAKLSKKRQKAARELKKQVEQQLTALDMPHCQFEVALTSEPQAGKYGLETPEFLIAPNPGQATQSLIKIASGGELSRISLAIQVVTASTSSTPVIAFDEVDVGIGGGTAEVVGKLLRQLGEHSQVLCVTHQPQVASQGHHHWRVSKHNNADGTSTEVEQLHTPQRVDEIARMLGGIEITNKTRDHAEEMLANS